jgi:hypothetical protein
MIARMIPMRTSTIFKNRWMALLWAAGVLWFAYDFVAPGDQPANSADNQVEISDASGAPVSPEEAKQLENAVNGL